MGKLASKDANASVSAIEKYLSGKYDFWHNPILERTEFKAKRAQKVKLKETTKKASINKRC